MLFKKDIRTLYKTKPRRKKTKIKVHHAGHGGGGEPTGQLKSKLG
jgi:hypothetical protein